MKDLEVSAVLNDPKFVKWEENSRSMQQTMWHTQTALQQTKAIS
jgi:hypothetical protein